MGAMDAEVVSTVKNALKHNAESLPALEALFCC